MSVYDALDDAGGSIVYDFSAAAGNRWQDQPKTIAAGDGDPVGVWSGTGHGSLSTEAIRATADANRPTFRANFNASGKPALEFDGTNDLMLIDPAGAPSAGVATWGLFAVELTANTAAHTIFSRQNGNPSQVYIAGANATIQTPNLTATANSTILGRFVYGFAVDPSTWLSAMGVTTRAGLFRVITSSGTPVGNFGLGGYPTGVNHWKGGVHQWMFGTGVIGTLRLFNCMAALANDWSMPETPIEATAGGIPVGRIVSGGV